MTNLGKIDRTVFENAVAANLGASRDDVALGPQHGVDFGVIDVDGTALVTATDPLSILPALGLERAARFALDLVLADVAVSGVSPSHLSICFTLPATMTDDEFATIQSTIHEGVSTSASPSSPDTLPATPIRLTWVGAATAMGVGGHDEIVCPDGARPGDRLLLTTGPAVESVGLLSTLFGDRIAVSEDVLADAQERLEDVYCVRDALTAAAAGPVTAMHDVTEGGLAGALNEMADGAGARFEIDREAVPMRPGVREVCETLEIDPWAATSCGSLAIAVDPAGVDAVRGALEDRGTVVAEIGRVTEEKASSSTVISSSIRASIRRGRPMRNWHRSNALETERMAVLPLEQRRHHLRRNAGTIIDLYNRGIHGGMRTPTPESRPVALTIAGSDWRRRDPGRPRDVRDPRRLRHVGDHRRHRPAHPRRRLVVRPADRRDRRPDRRRRRRRRGRRGEDGMLATTEVVELVADRARGFAFPLVVDP